MKASELRELTTPELQDKLVDEKTSLAKLRLTHTVSQLENPIKLRDTRKDIARIETELRRRQLEGDTK